MKSKRGFVGQMLARAVLEELVRVLSPAGIDVMPLKGVLLGATVYPDAEARPLTDVDVLVAPNMLSRALRALTAAGWSCGVTARNQVSVRCPRYTMPVDLHEELFPAWMFRMRAREVFARATRNATLFGFEIFLLQPLDLYAHLVGHFTKGRLVARDTLHLRDLTQVPRSHRLCPKACAAHLDTCGLGRAARYTLPLVSKGQGDEFACQVLEALAPDVTGRVIAAGARHVLSEVPRLSWWGIVPVHMLNHSLPAGAMSLGAHGLKALRTRWAT